ncbi:hypothetical protein QTI17_31275 [Variovorax sp. J31P179]|uniref:hypothetical protein n=1 Tax=Variovorax sp. J31P179 TaxID=3053508 RepID=UPI002574E317|nr:hypothetical protein [Variovorax sp. J31P179]MDM0085077.1 hypothetical protein [Variovorax sp. J31P179]
MSDELPVDRVNRSEDLLWYHFPKTIFGCIEDRPGTDPSAIPCGALARCAQAGLLMALGIHPDIE